MRDTGEDGWGSSEFEECEEDQRSTGAQSQGSGDHGIRRTKNLLRRVPARLSWGKSRSDVQAMVVLLLFITPKGSHTINNTYNYIRIKTDKILYHQVKTLLQHMHR